MTDRYTYSDLGGRQYSDAEQSLIAEIASVLVRRSKEETAAAARGHADPQAIRPRDYMPFYVKAAGSVYELAKTLSTVVIRGQPRQKTIDDWLRILTAHRFNYITDPNLVRNVVEVHVSEARSAKPTSDGMPDVDVTVSLPRPDAPTIDDIEQGRTHVERNDGPPGSPGQPAEDPRQGPGEPAKAP